MKVLFIIGSVAVVFTVFVVLVLYFADPPEDDPEPEPEVHHEAPGNPPWEPAPFPGPDPVLDYQPRFPLKWIERDEVAGRIQGRQ